ncbi:MAG: FtsX-like permease family protein [Candidatus Latescibacteria bacterium]|nr:FtsX-like permease family protein [Candidatus Latescibacterota bacterium]
MVFYEPIAVGLAQLRANKLRSLLTLLGIVIGVSSVIGIVSLGEGLRVTILGDFVQQGGATAVLVSPPEQWVRKQGRWVQRSWQEHLSSDDLAAIREETDQLRAALPGVMGMGEARHGKSTTSARYTGTSAEYAEGFKWPVEIGRHLTEDDVRYARRVCVIGHQILKDLFQDQPAVGEEIELSGDRYEVVGVLEPRIRFGREQGSEILIPYTTAQLRLTGNRYLQGITLWAGKLEAVNQLADAVRRVLRGRHEHGSEFRVRTGEKQMEQVNNIVGIMKMVAGGIAGISLLVGGIGIMNIMLVSVAERTREIGIRKALGAKPRHILFQFVVEALVLSLAGGAIGIFAGIGFGVGIGALIHKFAPGSPFSSVVSLGSVLGATSTSLVVGLFFGIYPAWRASRLDPVEALRYE